MIITKTASELLRVMGITNDLKKNDYLQFFSKLCSCIVINGIETA